MSAPKAARPCVREILVDAERTSRDQQYNIGHAAALLTTMAREAGSACIGRKVDSLAQQALWLRVEYLAAQIESHVAELDQGLAGVEGVLDQMGRVQ